MSLFLFQPHEELVRVHEADVGDDRQARGRGQLVVEQHPLQRII